MKSFIKKIMKIIGIPAIDLEKKLKSISF